LGIIWVLIVLSVLVLVFLILWIRERRNARIEHIAYGLREGENEEANENTRTNITQMQAEFVEAIAKLEELNLVKQDEWGRWFWIESGKLVGSSATED
jgi:hypothetical protein